jgi:hypothetical protein
MKFLRALVVALLSTTVSVTNAESAKQVYRVTAPKQVFDETLPLFGGQLDVWHTKNKGDGLFEAKVYATDEQIALFQETNATSIERDVADMPKRLESRSMERALCASKSRRRQLQQGTNQGKARYVDDPFFDCFRQADEVFAFLDRLVEENPKIFFKIPNITTTYEGRPVPAYKISTMASGTKPLYTQALIHAREWIAGSSTFYAIAALLDDLRAGSATTNAIFAMYEWHIVPILNIDGYIYSWTKDRLWRKNRRRISANRYGVDLNRNYGPASFFGRGGDGPASNAYPGTAMLSEPETAGSWAYLQKLDALGALDMHSHGGQIMRAYGNQKGEPPAPYGPKLKVLGDAVAKAAGTGYVSQTSAELYEAYGCFDDAVFQVLNRPVLTVEMSGDSFITDESTIRPQGRNMYRAWIAFAQQIPIYWQGLSMNTQSLLSSNGNNLGFPDLATGPVQRTD